MFGIDDIMLAAFIETAPEIFAVEAGTAAAEAAAAEAAAQQAAAIAAAQQAAAQQAAQTGIMEVSGATANAAAPLTTPEAVQVAAQQTNAGIQGMSPAQQEYLRNSSASFNNGVVSDAGIQSVPQYEGVVTSPVSGGQGPTPGFEGVTSGPQPPPVASPPVAQPPSMGSRSINFGSNSAASNALDANATPPPSPPSALMKGLNSAVDWAKANPFPAMTGAYLGANALGLLNPSGNTFNQEKYDGSLSKYKLSPDFKSSTANPADFQYKPRYAMGGGIMGGDSYNNNPIGYDEGGVPKYVPEYAKGGSLSDSIESYQKMLSGTSQEVPASSNSVGIYHDSDPDTRYQDAFTAAQIRQSKINKRANMQMPGVKRPTPMGQINLRPAGLKAEASGSSLDPENAASGGIMHSSLGGYADGGNPRLLKGPGDGMSDNIPATISGRQPARLADGEFVVPADVVSHLGNGSTEAGAKRLHSMMDEVRRARTGNPKQGKQINPKKYMPK